MSTRTITAAASIALLLTLAPGAQATFPACAYDPVEDDVQVFLTDDQFARLYVAEGGEIRVRFDPEDVDCGKATTENTDRISVEGSTLNDLIVITQNGPGGIFPSSIRFLINAGDGVDEVRLIGTPNRNFFRFGVDPADLGVAPAADLFRNGAARIRLFDMESASARMLGGHDTVDGNPGAGFDGQANIPLDLAGGRGADLLIGGSRGDDLDGGAGDDLLKGRGAGDSLRGRAGDDRLNGGRGVDDCAGGDGDDVLRACET